MNTTDDDKTRARESTVRNDPDEDRTQIAPKRKRAEESVDDNTRIAPPKARARQKNPLELSENGDSGDLTRFKLPSLSGRGDGGEGKRHEILQGRVPYPDPLPEGGGVLHPTENDATRVAPRKHVPDKGRRAEPALPSTGDYPSPKSGETRQLGILKNRFVLEKILGAGGMGVVYKARDLLKVEANDKDPYVAIKVLNEEFKAHPQAFISLQRESRKSQR